MYVARRQAHEGVVDEREGGQACSAAGANGGLAAAQPLPARTSIRDSASVEARGHAPPPLPQFTPHTWPDTPDTPGSPTAISSCLHYDKTEPTVQATIT